MTFLLIILVVHMIGLQYLWYHKLGWVNVVMHTVGGLWVAAVAVYLRGRYAPQSQGTMPWWLVIVYIVGATMIVGVAWEWGEYLLDMFFSPRGFKFRLQLGLGDTMGDLLSDFCGGLLFALYATYGEHKRKYV